MFSLKKVLSHFGACLTHLFPEVMFSSIVLLLHFFTKHPSYESRNSSHGFNETMWWISTYFTWHMSQNTVNFPKKSCESDEWWICERTLLSHTHTFPLHNQCYVITITPIMMMTHHPNPWVTVHHCDQCTAPRSTPRDPCNASRGLWYVFYAYILK